MSSDNSQRTSEVPAAALRRGAPPIFFPAYPVTVNYDLSVEQLVKKGKYYWPSHDVTSGHFPSSEKGVAEVLVYLVNFNYDISSEDVLKELDRQGLRPATLKELLSLSIVQPDLQHNNPIVGLGSTRRDSAGNIYIHYLSSLGLDRILGLALWDGDWTLRWRFAAVRK